MKVWTDKDGNKLTAEEFISRWKSGIQAITPLQQTKSSIFGYIIIFIGIIWGILMTYISSTWWLMVVLSGSLIISGIQFLGVYQRYLFLAEVEKDIKEVQHVQEGTKQSP